MATTELPVIRQRGTCCELPDVDSGWAEGTADVLKALADPTVLKRLQDTGVDPTPNSTPDKTAEFIKTELAKWAPIIRVSGARVD